MQRNAKKAALGNECASTAETKSRARRRTGDAGTTAISRSTLRCRVWMLAEKHSRVSPTYALRSPALRVVLNVRSAPYPSVIIRD